MIKRIPPTVVKRMPDYLSQLERFAEMGLDWVSSQDIADSLELTSSTVRQDLSHLKINGTSKRGYATGTLVAEFSRVLGSNNDHRMALVGAGNLGRALVRHSDFRRRGFHISAVYDQNPELHGEAVGPIVIQSLDSMAEDIRARNIQLGIIAVPSQAAQTVADQLVKCGIRGILNLAQVHIITPEEVSVVNARILASLQQLAYAINKNGAVSW